MSYISITSKPIHIIIAKTLARYYLLLFHFRLSSLDYFTCFITGKKDPCKGKQCSFGAKCVADKNGEGATCKCNTRCYELVG